MNPAVGRFAGMAFVVTVILCSVDIAWGQVLIDPRGEEGASEDSAAQDRADENGSTESTSDETETADSFTADSTSETADTEEGETTANAGTETRSNEDAREERTATETARSRRRTLPPPAGPDEQLSSRRSPPPRPQAALPAEPDNDDVADPQERTGRPFLGITFDPTVRNSAVVGAVVPDSPAAQAGLQPGDEIVAINDQSVGSIEEAFAVVGRMRPGETVDIEFTRRISARTQALLESAPEDAVAEAHGGTLPERRSTSYREPPRTDYEEPIPTQRENPQDRIRILRRYGDDRLPANPNDDESRDRVDRRELEEWLRERQRPPERPLRNRPLLRWRRG